MKKFLIPIIIVLIIAIIIGGIFIIKNNMKSEEIPSSSTSNSEDAEKDNTNKQNEEITLEEVLSAPETDPDEFQWSEGKTGIVISGCTSDDDIIVIPEKINGIPVTVLSTNGVNLLDCRALVLPNSMIYLESGSIGVLDNLEILVYGNGMQEGLKMPSAIHPNLKILYVKEGAKNIPVVFEYGADKLEKVYLPSSLEQEAFEESAVIANCGNPIFVVEKGSAAEEYAKENGYKCEYN